jgi:ammonia channel protein AmtB
VYFLLSFLLSSLIFPITLSWTRQGGWLSKAGFEETGLGSHVLLVGATAGFVLNLMIGPRFAMFNNARSMKEQNTPTVV